VSVASASDAGPAGGVTHSPSALASLRRGPLTLALPTWVPDTGAVCSVCAEKFTTLRRRHHCRGCGQLCCSPCSPDALPLLAHGLTSPQRLCQPCAAVLPLFATAGGLRVAGGRIVVAESFVALQERIRATASLASRAEDCDAALFAQQGGVDALLALAMSPIAEIQVRPLRNGPKLMYVCVCVCVCVSMSE
jgi:hypothetical protein